jgi:hypothetical protein
MIEPLPRMMIEGAVIDTLPDIVTAAAIMRGAV